MKRLLKTGILLAVCTGGSAQAALAGSINSDPDGGVYATESWDSGNADLSWDVSYDRGTNLWKYVYEFDVTAKDLSHIIFETSDSFNVGDVYACTSEGWSLGTFGSEGNSNPGIPGSIHGLKFDGLGLNDTFTIITDRVPVWGDFYAKDGVDGGSSVFAYNSSFGLNSSDSIYGVSPDGFLLVPDTVTTVPLPGALPLFGSALLGGLAIARRKQRAANQKNLR